MGLTKREFTLMLVTGLFVSACATAWPYKHYDLDVMGLSDPEKGFLRGPTAADDVPLTFCRVNATTKSPCVVMLQDVYFKLKADFEAQRRKLIACQQQNGG